MNVWCSKLIETARIEYRRQSNEEENERRRQLQSSRSSMNTERNCYDYGAMGTKAIEVVRDRARETVLMTALGGIICPPVGLLAFAKTCLDAKDAYDTVSDIHSIYEAGLTSKENSKRKQTRR